MFVSTSFCEDFQSNSSQSFSEISVDNKIQDRIKSAINVGSPVCEIIKTDVNTFTKCMDRPGQAKW